VADEKNDEVFENNDLTKIQELKTNLEDSLIMKINNQSRSN
jgi:hypothetical protein